MCITSSGVFFVHTGPFSASGAVECAAVGCELSLPGHGSSQPADTNHHNIRHLHNTGKTKWSTGMCVDAHVQPCACLHDSQLMLFIRVVLLHSERA
jgi:hypothetical protein